MFSLRLPPVIIVSKVLEVACRLRPGVYIHMLLQTETDAPQNAKSLHETLIFIQPSSRLLLLLLLLLLLWLLLLLLWL